jgi:beta-lactamase regulating signal transducer with metallopeptidase domain
MLFAHGFTLGSFAFSILSMSVLSVLVVCGFIIWFSLLIMVLDDLFRRRGVPRWAKATWVIVLMGLLIGGLGYLPTNGRSAYENNFTMLSGFSAEQLPKNQLNH